MIAWLIALLLAVSAPAPAEAWLQSRDSTYNNICVQTGTCAVASYSGPLDVVGTATACYSLRGCSAAYSTGSNNAITVRRASDNTTSNIVILANGNLDTATAATFAGTDASCTGTITSVVLTVSSCASGTIHDFDPISGTGITQPAYITSLGTGSGGAGTYNLNQAQSVGAGETITFQVALFITEFYNQSGGAGANIPQASTGNQPQLFLNGCGLALSSLPCVIGQYPPNSAMYMTATGNPSLSQPFTLSVVAQRVFGPTTQNVAFGTGASATASIGFSSTSSTAYIGTNNLSSVVSATASTSVWHALTGLSASGSGNAFLNVDGSTTTGTTTATGNTFYTIMGASNGGTPLAGYFTEAIVWASGLTSTQARNICHNQTYWYAFGC